MPQPPLPAVGFPPLTTGVFSGMPYGPAGYPWDAGIDQVDPEDWEEYQFTDAEGGSGPAMGSMVPVWSPHMNYPNNPIDYTDPGVTGFGPQAPAGNEPFGDMPLMNFNLAPALNAALQQMQQQIGQGIGQNIIPNLVPQIMPMQIPQLLAPHSPPGIHAFHPGPNHPSIQPPGPVIPMGPISPLF